MPVLVRNTAPGPVVFTDDKTHIEWQGAGDPRGEDVQYVPTEIVKESINFLRATQRTGLVIVDESDEIKDALAKQQEAQARKDEVAQQAQAEVIDRQSEAPSIVANVDEKGQVTQVAQPAPSSEFSVAGEAPQEGGAVPRGVSQAVGMASQETEIPVVIEPLQRG